MVTWGGYRITDVAWLGPTAVEVTFSTTLADRYWQLYVNRRLAGVTNSTTARTVVGSVYPASRATPLNLAAVSFAERQTPFGQRLSVFPFNRYRVSWAVPSVVTDLKRFDVVMATGAGTTYEETNIVGSVDYVSGVAGYSYDLPPFDDTGEWSVAVIGRDRTYPLGNAGTPAELVIPATVYPLDFTPTDQGRRFNVNLANGVLTASFAYGVA